MKRTIWSIVLALLAMCCLNVVTAQEVGNVLTNEDISTLTAGDVSYQVIVQKIRASETDFDTTAEALVLLSQAGTDDFVLVEMIQTGATEDRCADDSAAD